MKGGIRQWLALLKHRIKIRWIVGLGVYDKSLLEKTLTPEWEARIRDVMDCPDNDKISRVETAGQVSSGSQYMHNGIVVTLGGYYGSEISQMLQRNRGVHEPQEELAFDRVLQDLRPGSTMVELGSYWSFYSIWFLKKKPDGRSYLVEPNPYNIEYGKNNFRLNGVRGDFTLALIGSETQVDSSGQFYYALNDFFQKKKLSFVDILHSDIQGAEWDMLMSIRENLIHHTIGYLFISTHSQEIHENCLKLLRECNYVIACDADLQETYSHDGLIVAKSPVYPGVENIAISKKKKTSTT